MEVKSQNIPALANECVPVHPGSDIYNCSLSNNLTLNGLILHHISAITDEFFIFTHEQTNIHKISHLSFIFQDLT